MHSRAFPRGKEEATRELKDVGWQRVWVEKSGEEKNWEA